MITCLRPAYLPRIQSVTAGLSTCFSGSVILWFVLKLYYQNMEKLWKNLPALSRLVVVLQATLFTVSVKNTYDVQTGSTS